ncbi:hypothetical protein [Streptomyces sp. NPDC001404]|uniref:hypothetical protein n=1 Tax=Streptomyces sp. NPDC001404 TaxID=3364571 RepID=UPI00367364B7
MHTITADTVSVTSERALMELGRFFQLHADRTRNGDTAFMPMFSERIDATWHDLKTDPHAYKAFCAEHAGRSVTHLSTTGTGTVPWVTEYEETFGATLPVVWFASVDGRIDRDAYDRYLKTGAVKASWNCGPSTGDGDGSLTGPEQDTGR